MASTSTCLLYHVIFSTKHREGRGRRSSTRAGVLVMDGPSPVVSLRADTGYKL